jgi:hypothetical protein
VIVDTCVAGTPGTEGPAGDATCSDSIDNDCDGLTDLSDGDCSNLNSDDDGDGYTENQGDCDDTDANVYPGAPEICDGKDSNCDGNQTFTDKDKDGDGVPWCAGDCDDNDPNRYPGNEEIYGTALCSDGIDNDCDGAVDGADQTCASPCLDNDGDGYGANGDPACPNGTAVDCDDSNPAINPGASDANCNAIDEDCTGVADDGYVVTPTSCGVGGRRMCCNGSA